MKRRTYLDVWGEIGNVQEDTPGLRWSRYHHAVSRGTLTPGCRACQRRALHCIHVGLRCNLDCGFCPIPVEDRSTDDDQVDRALMRADLDILAERVHAGERIDGVSFTGGEPLMMRDALMAAVAEVRALLPKAHLWLYTNGILATDEILRAIVDAGISEVRFDIASLDYRPVAFERLRMARPIVPHLVAEVAVYPLQQRQLLDSLAPLAEIPIDQLVLQELVVTPANAARLQGDTYDVGPVRLLYGSRKLAYEVMQRCARSDYSFAVTECSAGVKYTLDQATPLGY